MNTRTLLILIAILGFVVGTTVMAQSKSDCPMKSSCAKDTGCCVKATKASGAKDCSMKGTDCSQKCSGADKGKCTMSKSEMMKSSGKSCCCKDKVKKGEAKNSKSTKQQNLSEISGKGSE